MCIDQTRVLLSDSDLYMNASWVDIGDRRKAIVAQTPMNSNALAFWTMIAEQGVQVSLEASLPSLSSSFTQAILLIMDEQEMALFDVSLVFPKHK